MTNRVVRLPEHLRDRIVEHCLAELPYEGCGLLALANGEVVQVYPTANEDRSAVSYTVPPKEHYRALVDAEKRGWELGGVFHSHPNGSPAPSAIDIARALEPDWVYVVVGLGGKPETRCWIIDETGATEVSLV